LSLAIVYYFQNIIMVKRQGKVWIGITGCNERKGLIASGSTYDPGGQSIPSVSGSELISLYYTDLSVLGLELAPNCSQKKLVVAGPA
jgi:hypothetical protein